MFFLPEQSKSQAYKLVRNKTHNNFVLIFKRLVQCIRDSLDKSPNNNFTVYKRNCLLGRLHGWRRRRFVGATVSILLLPIRSRVDYEYAALKLNASPNLKADKAFVFTNVLIKPCCCM